MNSCIVYNKPMYYRNKYKLYKFFQVADFSLSSFLGQLESPIKGSQHSQTEGPTIEGVRPPSDVSFRHRHRLLQSFEVRFFYLVLLCISQVVTHMQCLMGENSVDYMAKFANLASQMVSSEEQKKWTSHKFSQKLVQKFDTVFFLFITDWLRSRRSY